MTNKKPTPEQKKEQRLWKQADKACRALIEHLGDEVRTSGLTFSLERGIVLSMTMNLSFNVKVPKSKAPKWTRLSSSTKGGKRSTKQVFTFST